MERIICSPRDDWQQKIEDAGFIWHTAQGTAYWDESAAYVFNLKQIAEIEAATAELYQMFIAAGQKIIDDNLFDEFLIPPQAAELIRKTWDADAPSLNYGRFDFGYDGVNPPKMFEFNADTPTSLFEASIVQWLWKEEVFPRADQFNSIHEQLIEAYTAIASQIGPVVHFCSFNDEAAEDTLTTAYHRDCAAEAGLDTEQLFMDEIGWNEFRQCFVDQNEREIGTLFKLYPWEWLAQEEISDYIPKSKMQWLEPIYKMMWSNKRILPLLTEMFPGHPNLLASYLEPGEMTNYVRKPFLAREGANITVVRNGEIVERTEGDYSETDCVYQELFELPLTDGGYPVIGSWIVNGVPAGMGIREAGFVTNNTARFIPHIIK